MVRVTDVCRLPKLVRNVSQSFLQLVKLKHSEQLKGGTALSLSLFLVSNGRLATLGRKVESERDGGNYLRFPQERQYHGSATSDIP